MSDATLSLIDSYAEAGHLTGASPENIRRWLTDPCYAEFRERIVQLLEASDADSLAKLNGMFWTTIPFGTGGRRGAMGEMGPATMNARTIAESAHGLAVYMKKQKGREDGSAVVAHDTRHNSHEFARITATTFAAHGLKVWFFAPHARVVQLLGDDAATMTHRSTPLLSFAVRHLGCDIGAMISASHNPPSDNGFKAYWDTGAQVIAPHDRGIIECVDEAGEIPSIEFDEAVAAGRIVIVGDEVDEAFAEAVLAMSLSEQRDIAAVFSPLHGVGETCAFDVAEKAGFDGVTVFEPHRRPEGGFPNVADHFPNPERPEVFTAIIDAVQDSDCQLILATDPDADRVAVSVRGSDGAFVNLTGNQTGALICDYVCGKRKAAGTLTSDHFVVETLVTTPLTAAIARSYGARAITDLLVGFKHIAEAIDANGPDRFVFATEESIGYLAGQYARDKDASIATLYLLEVAAELRAEGKTLLDRLDELYAQHGVHAESQKSIYCEGAAGLEQIRRLMQAFRSSPPESLAGLHMSRVRDFESLEVRDTAGNVVDQLSQPHGNLVFLDSDAAAETVLSVAARPSGTEPKIKFYFFVRAGNGGDVVAAREQATKLLAEVASDLQAWADLTLESA